MITEKRKLLQLVAAVLLAVMLLTACASGASKAADKIELGQKYLTELNYTEAVASFTEAIRLDPDNIQAYMGRAEAYLALGEYEKALEDYRFVSQKTEEMPYTRAISYMGQAEVYEKIDKQDRALADYGLAKVLLTASDVGKAESVSEDDIKIKLVEALYAHAMLSEKIKVYDNALEDYEELLKLGEKVEAKRGEILSQLGESIEEENGLLGTEADKVASEPNTEEPIEEKLTEEPAAEQKASSASESQSEESTQGADAAEQETTGPEQKEVRGYYASIGIRYEAGYAGLKEMIAYVNNFKDRTTISQFTANYDDSTGKLNGEMTLNMYYLENTGKEYVPPVFPNMSKGVMSIFGRSTSLETAP